MDIGPTYFSKDANTCCSGTFVSLQTYFDDDSESRIIENALLLEHMIPLFIYYLNA